MKSKTLVFSLLVMFTANSFATIKIWDGGGADAYLATQENWSDDVAPVSGDYLVLAGSTRTSVTNDYDPETTSFKMIVFSNDCSTCSTPFTLSGNEIVLTGCVASEYPAFTTGLPAIGVVGASSSITEILDLDIRLPNNSKLGTYNTFNHHLTFNGMVTGSGGLLQSCDQYKSTLTFEGAVTNFSGVKRPNGNALIWLRSAANAFTSSTFTHEICQGTLKVDSLDAYGGYAAGILLGQNRYNTPGRFSMNADQDTRIDGNLTVCGPRYYATAGTFENLVVDTLLTLGGDLNTVTGSEGSNPLSNLGTMVTFGGVGNGVFLGNVTTASTWLNKSGAGTWEFAGGSTSSSTGDVTISEGTLILNGDYASMKTTTVKSGATLAGTSTVDNVTFESGANYRVYADTDDIHPLILTGSVTLSGSVDVSISAAALAALTPGVEYTLISYTSKSGVGVFTLGDGFPTSALLTERSDSLVVQLTTGMVSWKGDATNNVWDTTTLNWLDSALYSDGNNALFSDTADAGTTNVTISSAVRPLKVTVTGSRNYTFSGEGIEGLGMLEKPSGTSSLTLNNTNAYTGVTLIQEGALVLNGTIADSSVYIDSSAIFTNTASGRLTGSASLVINGKANLSGSSDFTGGTTIDVPRTYALDEVAVIVNDPRALGSGDVSVVEGTVTFQENDGSFGLGSTLTLGESGGILFFVENNIDVAWLGDVEIVSGVIELRPRSSSSSITFGEPGCSTEVRSTTGGFFVRESGQVHWYSRLRLGGGSYEQTDYNTSHFYATGNEWSYLLLKANGAVCHATNTLAPTRLSMGQIYETTTFAPSLDLNGYDQTIAELEMVGVIEGSTQTIKSDTPAMLTISNATDTVTARQQGRIEGLITLRKQGTGNWSFGCANLSEGDFIVEGGTVTLTASDTLPTASEDSRLTVLEGAKIAVSDGVNALVPRFTYNDVQYTAGVYGGVGCAVPGARILPECFEPGTGVVTVTRGDGGFLIMIR
jgi:autotransporter-associated beta strand protein